MNAISPIPPTTLQVPKSRTNRADQEFLPAAIEILEIPPSPVGVWLLWIICALAAAALLWSYFGRIDIIAVAQGKIQPTGRVKVIQPLDTGRVASVSVENGQRVHEGDVLVTFDSGESDADVNQLLADLDAYKAEAARRQTAINAVKNKVIEPIPEIIWPPGIPEKIEDREKQVLNGDLQKLESTIEGLRAQQAQKQREGERYIANVAALTNLVATLQSSVDMRSTLKDYGSGSRVDLINAIENLQEKQVALATAKGQIAESAAAVDVLAQQIEGEYRTFLSENLQKQADAERQIDLDEQKLAKARIKQTRTLLRSPIEGTVSGLSITTVGQVVGAGEEVMRVVPNISDKSNPAIEIEAYVENRDIGFVRPGQDAIVKIESLPFTRYGTVDAKLIKIASDAIHADDAQQREADPTKGSNDHNLSDGQRTNDLVFSATFNLKTARVLADGAYVPLSPGMAVTVEIKTGSRRIIDYLFSPLVEVASEAMKER